MHRAVAVLLCLVVCAIGNAQGGIVQFSPGLDQVPSVRVSDMVLGRDGECYLATDNGLAIFDGSWRTLHPNHSRRGEGILSDRVLSLERDAEGTLWIGYSTGLQWYNGSGFTTFRDQQLLKNLIVQDILRQDDAMWIASGDAGLHRYRNGTWTWFKPHGESGLSCNHIYSMARDPESGAVYFAGGEAGVFVLENGSEPVRFQPLPGSWIGIRELRSDPTGGILLFNGTHVYHLRRGHSPTIEIRVDALFPRTEEILDVARTPAGELLLATDSGIFLAVEGQIQSHIGKPEGLWGSRVRRLFLDGEGRCWFTTPASVGYIYGWSERSPLIPIRPPEGAGGPSMPVTPPPHREPAGEADRGQNAAAVPQPPGEPFGGVEACIAAVRTWLENLFSLFP
ncbi:MAG: hypothetical protein QMD46_08010 [Methanomicrobiales archaeon]|nr:hypothetical protein [Methanomicrobiales archaeon]MDI6877322.1 hypothetical protein [Methanomicrobiales archaeon]